MRGAKDQPRTRGSHRLWLEQHVQLSRGHWRREEGAGAIRSAGWRESVTVTWLSTTTPERRPPLLHRTGDHLRHDRPLDRRTHGRNRPALARTPAPHTHGISVIPPAPAQTPPGKRPGQTRSHDGRGLRRPRTLLWSRGPTKKLIVVLAACARQVGEPAGPSPAAPRGGNAHRVTCAAAPARE